MERESERESDREREREREREGKEREKKMAEKKVAVLTSSSQRESSVSLSNMISGVTKSGRTFFQKSGSLTSISACSKEDSPVNMLFLRVPNNGKKNMRKFSSVSHMKSK